MQQVTQQFFISHADLHDTQGIHTLVVALLYSLNTSEEGDMLIISRHKQAHFQQGVVTKWKFALHRVAELQTRLAEVKTGKLVIDLICTLTSAPSVWIFVYLNFKYVILRVFLFGEGGFDHA